MFSQTLSSKKVFSGNEIGEFYLHKPVLTNYKYYGNENQLFFSAKKTFNYFDRTKGRIISVQVPDVCEILLRTFRDGFMILNGTHRCFEAYGKGYNLAAYVAENFYDMKTRIPKKVLQEHSLEHLTNLFSNAEQSFADNKKNKIVKVKDLYEFPSIEIFDPNALLNKTTIQKLRR